MGGRSSVLSFTKWVILGKAGLAGSPDQVSPLSNKEGNRQASSAPTVCFLLRMPHFQRWLTLSLGRELMVSKQPLVISVGSSALYDDQEALVHLFPLCGWAASSASTYASSFLRLLPRPSLLPQGDRRPGREKSWGCCPHSHSVTQGKGAQDARGLESTSAHHLTAQVTSPGLGFLLCKLSPTHLLKQL